MSVVRARARLLVLATVSAVAAVSLTLVAAPSAQAAPPSIIGPANGDTVTQIPTLSWQRLDGAAKYDVQVSASDTFSPLLVDAQTVNSQYVPVVQLPAGHLYWRVRVTNSGDTGWANADFNRGALDVPTMLGPTGTLAQPDSPPLLSWTPVQGALAYNLQVSTDPDFIDPTKIVNYTPVKVTSGINPVLVVPGTYYARVRATMGTNIFTGYSPSISYTIAGLPSAARTSPADGAAVTDAVVDWKPVPGAATYELQMDDDINFGSPAVSVTGITGTRFAPPKTIGNDQYYWRVRPVDVAGNARAYTAADRGVFQRSWPGQVHLQYPLDTATVGNPFYYQWSPSERTSSDQEDLALSSSYTLEVSQSSTFQGTVMRCNTVNTTWVPGSSLNGNSSQQCWPTASGTYYWRVIGHDDYPNGNRPQTEPGNAEVHSFTYAPEVPSLISPINNAHVTIPTLSWSPVRTAARYKVVISSTLGGTLSATTASTSYTPDVPLDPGSYTWQVQTVSQDNRLGTSFIFDTGSFVVDPMPAAVASVPTPVNSPSGRRFPTLKWDAVAGAQSYEVWAKPVASAAYTLLGEELYYPATESLDGTFLDPGDYNWFVKAFNVSGGLISSSVATPGTFTINPLEVVPDEQHYAALAGTLLPDDPEHPDTDLGADACETQILNVNNQSACTDLRNTPVLRWAEKPNVGYYLLYVAKDKAMTNPVYDTNNDGIFSPIVVNQAMWTPPGALPDSQAGTAYFYKVVPCSFNRCEALTAAQHSFDKLSRQVQLEPVQETLPNASAPTECQDNPLTPEVRQECQNDVTLSWADYRATEKSADPDAENPLTSPGRTEARSYIVQTATDSSFNNLIESIEVDQTTFTSYATTYPEGTVYWRVRAVDASGNALEWSDTGVFDKKSPAPTLLSPDGTSDITGDMYFSWQSLPFAALYRIEVYKNHDTAASSGNLAFPAATVGSRMVSLTNRLAQLPAMPNGDDPYVWRVRRVDAAGRAGAWSSWGEFTVAEPTTSLTSPADSASVPPSDGLFSWSAVPGAESYKFERRVVGTLTSVEPATTRALSWAPQLAIAGGNWEWRVTPLDPSGQAMTPTAWRPFSVDDTVAATSAVAISGSGRVGTPLTVSTPPVWNFGAAVTTTYQWYRNSTAIGGATSSTYDVTTADLGKSITVRALGTRSGYLSGTSTSNAIAGIAGSAPVAVVEVTVTGTGKVGTALTLTPPTWDSDQVVSSYRWQRDGVDVTGTAGSGTSYTVLATDVGKQLTVKATGTRTGYDPGTSVSSPVTGVAGDAPAATTPVSISGPSNKVGQTWTVSPPAWDVSGVTTTYQWYRDGTAITGATKTTYKLVAADIGMSVAVQATGTKAGLAPGQSTSNPVVAEQLDTNSNIAPPSFTGTPAARETLTANPGTWPSGTTYTYQWFVNGLAVARETKATYVVRTRDAGLPVKVRVTGSKAGFLPGEAYSPQATVAKLPTLTTAGFEESTISKRARAVLNVHVDVVDLGVPLGKVQVTEGKKVLATVQLKNDSRGNVVIRLKKLLPGKHKIVVTYLGSVATETSKSKKVKLTVLKK